MTQIAEIRRVRMVFNILSGVTLAEANAQDSEIRVERTREILASPITDLKKGSY